MKNEKIITKFTNDTITFIAMNQMYIALNNTGDVLEEHIMDPNIHIPIELKRKTVAVLEEMELVQKDIKELAFKVFDEAVGVLKENEDKTTV